MIGHPFRLLWDPTRTRSDSLPNRIACLIGYEGGFALILVHRLSTGRIRTGNQGDAATHCSDDGTNRLNGTNDTGLENDGVVVCFVQGRILLSLKDVTCVHDRGKQSGSERSGSERTVGGDFFFCERNTNPREDIERMEGEVPYRLVFAAVVIAVIVGGIVYLLFGTPLYPRALLGIGEGFVPQNVSKGLRSLPEAGELLAFLDRVGKSGKSGKSEMSGGNAVRGELELLLHKMAALVADVTSADRIVNQTRHLPFETAHDRMVVGEICGMCLQQTLSARDVGLFLEAWRARGSLLLRKLCTVEEMSEADAVTAEKFFYQAWSRVYEVATVQCVKSLPSDRLGARDAAPFEPGSIRSAGSYDYTYGGLSASGWNGAV